MITADTRSLAATSNRTKVTRVAQPLLTSEICSKVATPVPPSTSATRHESLAHRNRKTGALSSSRISIQQKDAPGLVYRNLGLEVRPERVIWKGWEPGEEYTRNLTLKNVHVKTQKIRYKVPSSRFFSTLFPQVVVLSAGTSFTLPITFRPLEKERYEDKIEFITSRGSFTICLQALLPELNLHLPESVHFGLSAVHDTAELTFEMRNLSTELIANYSWEVPEPFAILPSTGSLPPKTSCWVRGVFRPTSARVYEASVICFYGDDKKIIMKWEGVGKFPHLLISTESKISNEINNKPATLVFGSRSVHQSVEKLICLHNLSNVKAQFKFSQPSGTAWMDRAYTCHVADGVLPPMGSMRVPIKYTPQLVDATSIDYFEVSTVGNIGKSTLKCIGGCNGPNMQLSASTINFGVVTPEKSATHTLQLQNDSGSPAYYQIHLDEEFAVFSINANSGLLQPNETKTAILTFSPPYPINYYKKVTILVHDQEPLFLHLMGSCHSAECKPPPLKSEHLERYNVHASRGLSFYSPDILNNQFKEGKVVEDNDGCLILASDDLDHKYPPQSGMLEYFDDGHNTEVTHHPPHVSLDRMSIWMGEVQFKSSSQEGLTMTLQMTNHTRGKITTMWIPDPLAIFQVVPSICDIPPMKSTDFRVIFKPNAPNQFFGKQLECYAFYKCLRDYRLVEEKFVCPPWLVAVDVAGHTFNGKNETFLPEYSLSSSPITMPPVTSNESSFRTILLENHGTSSILYQFLKNNNHFTVKPSHGLTRSKYHISVVRLVPDKVADFQTNMTLRLNDNVKHDQDLKLIGTGEQAELLLGNCGELFFRPTCIRTCISSDYEVHNAGRLPIKFKWVLSKEDAKHLSIEQPEGIMLPNETQKHLWTFQPSEVKKYVFKPQCLAWPYNPKSNLLMQYASQHARKFVLRAVGEGSEGDIKAERCNIDYGCVISGTSKAEPLVIVNDSQCDLHFKLSVEQFINSQYGDEPDENEPIGLKLNKWNGVIAARSKTVITAMVHPYRRVLYTWSLFYELFNSAGKSITPNCKYLLCQLSADGVFPTLAITDARSSGSGANISKTQLWRWFSLEHLNSCLDSDPDEAELIYSVSTRHSTSRRPSVYTKSIMDFNFGAASITSEPCYVSMMVKNSGSVATEWAFLFPKDLELDIDYWAESGLFDSDELHELHIQDNKLFTVYPSKGNLQPGESRTILFTYKHDVAGTHRLPVLLKIEKGKEILINFIGVTVELNRQYLHFPGTKHVFTPVPIGGPTPPKQLYEMYNGGAMAAIYEVDLAPLHLLESSNYDHPVFTCLNPQGEISPGTSANLEWIFSPLESKTYVVDIPIHIVGGDTALITFKGIGYDSRTMGTSMPMFDQPPEYTAVPSSQRVPVPGQLLFLSEERIGFGNIPLFGRARHVVFLMNKSENRPITYSWHATSEVVNDVLRVEPVQGYLEPGQKVMTKISFCAAGQPSFYDLDLICEVVDEIKMGEYHSELAAWEKEQNRQVQEFVITDNDTDDVLRDSRTEFHTGPSKFESFTTSPRRNLENVLNKRTSPIRLTESKLSNVVAKSEKKSYSTLPPIRFEDPVKFPSNRSRLLRQSEAAARNEWVQPCPPKPFIAHLGVTARTHDIAEFRTNFGGDNNKQFIDRTLQIDYPVPPKSSAEDQYPLTTCNDVEKEMVVSVMSDVIRGLLDDPTFHEAVKDLTDEVVPFFRQVPRDEKLDEEEQRKDERESEEKLNEPVHGDNTSDQLVTEEMRNLSSPGKFMDEILKHEEEVSLDEGAKDRDMERANEDSPRALECEGRSTAQMSLSQKNLIDDQLKKSPLFGALLEDILASTVGNIMEEALKGEVILTARPRVIALPPSRVPSAAERQQPHPPSSQKGDSSSNKGKRSWNSSSRVSTSSKR
ncbi:unnamed protein product [Clavelina lepadiformis]|uniref:MSP domain-containing protein n=1 Tax=Clavelina lepadiformis TaxID=159417 RepID=A0ABP0F663_CLALP